MSLRSVIRPAVDFTDRRFVEGTEEQKRAARDEAAEQIRLYQQNQLPMQSQLPEIERNRIEFGAFRRVEVEGEFYSVIRGVVDDPRHSPAVAWFINEAGGVTWLERPTSGPRNQAELEQREAEREQRRSAPKPVRTKR